MEKIAQQILKDAALLGRAIGILILVLVGLYVFARLRTTYHNQRELVKLTQKVKEQEDDLKALKKNIADEFQSIKFTVYGPLTEPERKPIVIEPTWLRNRDKAINERLTALELWRISIGREAGDDKN